MAPKREPRAVDLDSIVVTHHAKLGHPSAPTEHGVRDMRAHEHQPAFPHGVCARSIDTRYAFSTAEGAQDVGIAQALAAGADCGLGALATRGEQPDQVNVDASTWATWQDDFDALRNRAPTGVSPHERLTFWEREDGRDVLVTPITAVALVHELNRRVGAWVRSLRQANQSQSTEVLRPPGNLRFPIGGANPQNVGAIVNKNTEITRRGGFTALKVVPPRRYRQDSASRMVRRLAASGRYASVPRLNAPLATRFAARAHRGIQLREQRLRHQRDARELVAQFLDPAIAIWPISDRLGDALDGIAEIDSDERAWLAGRPCDTDRLAERFAAHLANRIGALQATRHSSPPPLPDNAHAALKQALREVL